MIGWIAEHRLWWAVWLTLSLLFAILSEGKNRQALWVISGALVILQFPKMFVAPNLLWLVFAAAWVFASAAIWRQAGTIAALTLLSAMCYPLGRFGGFEFAPGDPMWVSPLFWADMALLAAILALGGRGCVYSTLRFGNWFVDWSTGGRWSDVGRVAHRKAQAPKD